MPSSRAQRRAYSRAGSASTWITPSSRLVSRFLGMKPAPMPWMGWGAGAPPRSRAMPWAPPRTPLSCGELGSLSTRAVPERWPPVPTPVMSASSPSGKSARISWAVVHVDVDVGGFSNCCGIHAPGFVPAVPGRGRWRPSCPFRGASGQTARRRPASGGGARCSCCRASPESACSP